MTQAGSRRRCKQWTAAEKEHWLSQLSASGLSVREFSRREGIQKTSLWRWKRERAESVGAAPRPPAATVRFAPVQVASPSSVVKELVLADVRVGDALRVRVYEGADTKQVASLIKALSGGSAC